MKVLFFYSSMQLEREGGCTHIHTHTHIYVYIHITHRDIFHQDMHKVSYASSCHDGLQPLNTHVTKLQ